MHFRRVSTYKNVTTPHAYFCLLACMIYVKWWDIVGMDSYVFLRKLDILDETNYYQDL